LATVHVPAAQPADYANDHGSAGEWASTAFLVGKVTTSCGGGGGDASRLEALKADQISSLARARIDIETRGSEVTALSFPSPSGEEEFDVRKSETACR